MKKIILAITCIVTMSLPMDILAQQLPPSIIKVTGEGSVKVVPDGAIVTARVENQGETARFVKERNDQTVSDVITYCKKAGLQEKHIKTEYVNLNKNYDYSKKIYNFVSNQTIRIEIMKLEDFDKIMSGLLASGINRINGVQFTSTKSEELKAKARKNAVLNAKEKAEAYTAVLGQGVGKAIQITEQAESNRPIHYSNKMMMRSADASSSDGPSIAPGEMTIAHKIHITFELK